ncbi:hypothetical protein [Nocardia noduli]|uniref:hypothetical protein n=1 Tax=Nocardia noduli TaxID=2815722 RepID=UPI001C242318|nr:hypothetical protein [Nocardia noduli]
MTSSDSGSPGPGPDNPFDTGLPMLRQPVKKQPKKRRRPPVRTGPAAADPLAETPDYPAEPPLPDPGPASDHTGRSGDWEQWLEPVARTRPVPEPIVEPPPRARHEDVEPPPDDDPEIRVPSIVDRTGGNPGVALRRPRRTTQEQGSGGSRWLGALIGVGIVVALGAVVLIALHGSDKKRPAATESARARPSSTVAARTGPAPGEPAVIATPGCEQRRAPGIVSGTDPGGTTDGPSAILAFERAYYVQRSGFAARAVVAENSLVPLAEQIQRGINQVPMGTLYCVEITPAEGTEGQTRWRVRLTQQVPGEEANTFTQLITTRTSANRTLITAIAPG